MRLFFCSLMLTALSAPLVLAQQSDEVRTSSGLPTQIAGGRASQNPQFGIEVSGVLLVDGEGGPTEPPEFLIYIVSTNNSFVFGRQKVKNKGSFRVEGVPTTVATLVLEINGAEFARYPLNLAGTPIVRQDITLTWKQIGEGLAKAGVINARKYYQRADQNQKLFDKALAEKNNKKTDSAIKIFKEIVNNDPKDFVSWTELGNLYFESKPKEAQESYQKALEVKPDYFYALLNFGKLQLAQKNYDPAVETLTKAATSDPASADANHYLGESYLGAKKGSKAVVYLNEAIRLAPVEKAEIHLRLAALYNGANLKDRAVAEYKLFLAKVPNHPEKKKIEQYISDNSPK